MTATVLPFTGISRLDIAVERIIQGATDADLSEVVIIGFDADGDFYFSGSKANGGDVLWLLERAKHKLMQITDQMEDGNV